MEIPAIISTKADIWNQRGKQQYEVSINTLQLLPPFPPPSPHVHSSGLGCVNLLVWSVCLLAQKMPVIQVQAMLAIIAKTLKNCISSVLC